MDQGSFLCNVRNTDKAMQRQSGVLAKGSSIDKKQGHTHGIPQGQASENEVNQHNATPISIGQTEYRPRDLHAGHPTDPRKRLPLPCQQKHTKRHD